MSIIGPDRGSYRAMTHPSQVMRNTLIEQRAMSNEQ